MDDVLVCPAVCTQQVYIYINVLGLLFGVFAIVLFLLRKNILSKWRLVSFWIFIVLFLFFFVQIKYNRCGSGCSSSGIYLKGLQLTPQNILPFSTTR